MLLPQINNLLFYKHIFRLRDIAKGCLIYLFYLFQIHKNPACPLTINFLITSSCNFKCNICSFSNNRNLDLDDITINDIEEFISTQFRYKPFIFFSGGEPFMRDDFIDILHIVKKYNLKCGINTSGYILDSPKIKQLVGLEIELMIFSLYGPEETHDAITGIKGSYARTTENINLFCKNKSKKTKVVLSCTATKANVDSLEDIPLIARRLGADAVKFEHLNFLSNIEFEKNSEYFAKDNYHVNTFITDFDDSAGVFTKKLIEKLKNIKRKYGNFVFIKPDLNNEEIRNWYSNEFHSKRKCFFIWHSIFVRPDGIIVPCQFFLNYELGNIREANLKDIFYNEKILNLRKLSRKRLLSHCSRCCKL